MDRLAGMESFVNVVEAGSFSTAAKRLGLTRAVVGKRIAALEQGLGAQLLNRTTRHVSVTGPGAEFYERARNIVSEFALASQELLRNQVEPEGLIKVNAPMSFGQLHLAPALFGFMARCPKIVVQLTLTDRFVDPIAEGYDLVLRIGEMEDSSLIGRRLAQIPLAMAAAPSYLLSRGSPQIPGDLATHDILHYGLQRSGTRWRIYRAGQEFSLEVPIIFCANNGDVLCSAALAGRGIVMLPTFLLAQHLQSGRLQQVLPDYEATPLDLHFLWPQNRLLPTRIRWLVDFLVERFAEEPYWHTESLPLKD